MELLGTFRRYGLLAIRDSLQDYGLIQFVGALHRNGWI